MACFLSLAGSGRTPRTEQSRCVHKRSNRLVVYEHDNSRWMSEVSQVAGKPGSVDALRHVWAEVPDGGSLSSEEKVDLTASAFSFPLDDFQLKAIRALARSESVVVAAPTGSGKTVIGEAAVYLALAQGLRVFYTTPLKALSNQKYSDFKNQFGASRVGLLTGDVSANRDADILVMTTEVYRNMLYASDSGFEVSGVGPSIMDNIYAVVFDEFHYMNDRERGTVWEESVIISPKRTLLVALSATMRNVDEVRAWFSEVHGATELVVSSFRPVPLDFAYCNRDGLFALTSQRLGSAGRNMINPKVCSTDVLKAAKMRVEHRGIAGDWDDDVRKGKKPRRGNRKASPAEIAKEIDYMFEEGMRKGRMLKVMNARPSNQEIPSYGYLTRCLRKRSMLPAIVFIFSRDGCDRAAGMIAEGEHSDLLTEEEAKLVDEKVSAFETAHPGLIGEDKLRLARKGISSHHAGLLPIWKSVVEELFQDGLIKVVFATETLAAGINMPARTTAISSLSKRAGADGIVELSTSEVFQMAGRAGRRGKDKRGTCVFLRSQFEGAETAYNVINQDVEALNSTFAATFGMVLNLLKRRNLDESKELVEKSFGAFLMRKGRQERLGGRGAMSDAEMFVEAKKLLETAPLDEVSRLAKLSNRLRTEQKVLKKLAQINLLNQIADREQILPFVPVGTKAIIVQRDADTTCLNVQKVELETHLFQGRSDSLWKPLVEYAVVLGNVEINPESGEFTAVLTQSNEIRLLLNEHFVHIDVEGETLKWDKVDPKEWKTRFVPPRGHFEFSSTDQMYYASNDESRGLADLIPEIKFPPVPGHLLAQKDLMEGVRQKLSENLLYDRKDRRDLVKAFKAVKKLKKQFTVEQLRSVERKMDKLSVQEESNWKVFMSAAEALQEFGFLTEDHKVTELGSLGASLRSSNELWISMVLLSDSISTLQPPQLAGLISVLLAEGARRDQVITFQADPETLEAVEDIRPLYSNLETAQRKKKLDIVITLDESDAGMVEAWAKGTIWSELMKGTNLQEGDVCRRLRRVMDMLRQIPRLPVLSEAIKLNARRAIHLMDRFPVADDVTYVVRSSKVEDSSETEDGTSDEEYIFSVVNAQDTDGSMDPIDPEELTPSVAEELDLLDFVPSGPGLNGGDFATSEEEFDDEEDEEDEEDNDEDSDVLYEEDDGGFNGPSSENDSSGDESIVTNAAVA